MCKVTYILDQRPPNILHAGPTARCYQRPRALLFCVLQKSPSYSWTFPHNPMNPQINLILLIPLFILFGLTSLTALHTGLQYISAFQVVFVVVLSSTVRFSRTLYATPIIIWLDRVSNTGTQQTPLQVAPSTSIEQLTNCQITLTLRTPNACHNLQIAQNLFKLM